MLFGEGPKIKNIASDLNNLFRQGSMLNQSGQTVEGDSTADQGTSDLLAARDPVIQEISVGMSGEQAARYTVSGTPPLSLPNSLGKPLKAWEVDLLPYQDLHGYANPWPAGGGVNKFDESTTEFGKWVSSNGSITNDTFGCRSEKIAITGGIDCGIKLFGTTPFSMAILEYDSSNTFIVRDFAQGQDSVTATLNANTAYVRVEFAMSTNSSDVITPEILASYKAVFYLGSTAPSAYSPYSNVCPINGTDKVTITTAGVNLADQEHMAISTRYAILGYTDFSDAAPNGTLYLWAGKYTLSVSGVVRWESAFLLNSSGIGTALSYNNNSVTFTVATSGVFGIRLIIKTEDFTSWDDIDIMLNMGETALPYEPYVGTQTPITLPQTVYTGTVGSEGGVSRWGEVDLGTLNYLYVTTSGVSPYFAVNIDSMEIPASIGTIVPNVLCEKYKPAKRIITNFVDGCVTTDMAGHVVQLQIKDLSYTDAAEFKASLQGVKLIYKLATPTTFAVPSVTIPTPRGTASAWATAEDGTVDSMEVTYVGKA